LKLRISVNTDEIGLINRNFEPQ